MQNYPHRIRLRGPWQCEPLQWSAVHEQRPRPAPMRFKMPSRWSEHGLAEFVGTARFRRRFGYPGRIDEAERVWLVLENALGVRSVAINDKTVELDVGELAESEITALLRERNELVIERDVPPQDDFGDVALEIRRTAFLRCVTARAQPDGRGVTILATGQVAGMAERPLDLYLLADGATLAQCAIEAAANGAQFELTSETIYSAPAIAQIELVDGGIVWYTSEVQISLPSEGRRR